MSANALGAGDARPANSSPAGSAVRRPTAWLAAFGVVILLAAAFALSYDAFAALAREGGVNARLARFYPGVFDATLVVAFAALFVLRTARVYVRLLTWLSAFLVLAVCAAAGAAYAAEVHIPQRPLAAAVATAPFLLLVLAFRLWLTMLRHIRRGTPERKRGRKGASQSEHAAPEPAAVERGPGSAPPLALLPGAHTESDPPAKDEPEPAYEQRAYEEPAPEPVREPAQRAAEPVPVAYEPEPAYEPEQAAYEADPEPEPAAYEPEPAWAAYEPEPAHESGPAAYELEPELDDRSEPADAEYGADVRDEQAPADEPREPTLRDLAAVVELAELGDPVASLEPDADKLDANRPPLPRRQRSRPGAETGEDDEQAGDEAGDEEQVGDDEPQSDPVSDEAEPIDVPDWVNQADELTERDEFAEFEAEEVPPPPSGRVRSSPLPPLDWGPGLGGLTGRRRTPRANGGSDTV